MYSIYVLLSERNGKTYVGMTEKEPVERLKEHNEGKTKWTSGNIPFKLIYYEKLACKKDAILREQFLKFRIGNRVVKALVKEFGT